MAPKAVNRQLRRAEDTTPSTARRPLDLIDKVHLPALQDTPGSRRQYSYGAAVEPIAPRLSGSSNTKYDLGNAIQNALANHAEELEEVRATFPQPQRPAPAPNPQRQPKPQIRRATQEPDEDDELASAAFPPPRRTDPVAPSDGGDDIRSFGVESDVYGDATIVSTLDVDANPTPKSPQRTNNRRDLRRRATKSPADPAFKNVDTDESSADELSVRRSRRQRRQSSKPINQPQRSQSISTNATSTLDIGRSRQTHLPAKERVPKNPVADTNQATHSDSPTRNLARQSHLKQSAQMRPAVGQGLQKTAASEEEAHSDRSDHSEQDSALQKDIQNREDVLDGEREGELARQRWQQRWDYMHSLSPSNFLRSRFRQVPVTHVDEEGYEDENAESSWHRVSNSIAGFFSTIWRSIVRHIPSLYNVAAFVTAVILLVAILPTIMDMSHPPDLFEGERTSIFSSLGSLKSISDSIGSVVPVITRPFRGGLDDRFALSDFDNDGRFQLENFLRRYGEQFEHLKKAGLMHSQSIKKLENIVPRVVHMKLHEGKPIVAQEFWYALLELIQAEDTVLTIQEDGQLPDRQWKLVSSRLLDDAGLESKVSNSVSSAETRMEQKIASLWDKWVKENDGKLQSMLGDSVEKLKALGTDQELNDRIERIIKEHSKTESPVDSILVTRDEFLRHLKNEFTVHRSEIKDELNKLQPQVQKLVDGIIQEYGLRQPERSGLGDAARAEVSALVRQAVSEALVNVNLESVAGDKIHHHWDQLFKNNINFFSTGSGATINPKHSSATYDPYGNGIVDRRDLKNGLRGIRRWHHSEALMDWSEDGDMWCAARGVNLDGKPYGYLLGVQLGQPVIPQHIVVEHILPGATIDPSARPREMEIYLQIEDPDVRERVRGFSVTHITQPTTEDVVAPLDDDMILVGRFTYAGAELHDGVYVHQLSSELKSLGAETTEVVIRAVNNYGAPDHTCFYRVRMYGVPGEGEVPVRKPDEKKKSFW